MQRRPLWAPTYLKPDFVFYSKATGVKGLNAETALLVVEVSGSRQGYDLGRKALLHASFGIVELWIVDTVKLATRVHRAPTPTGYRSVFDLSPNEPLVPQAVPALAVVLGELEPH